MGMLIETREGSGRTRLMMIMAKNHLLDLMKCDSLLILNGPHSGPYKE